MNRKTIIFAGILLIGGISLILSQTVFRFVSPFKGLDNLPDRVSVNELDHLLSPDGNWLLSRTNMTDAEIAPGQTGLSFEVLSTMDPEQRISVSLSGNAYRIAEWSPDSSMVAVLVNATTIGNVCFQDEVLLVKMYAAIPVTLTQISIPPGSGCMQLVWSPDSSAILLYSSGETGRMIFFDSDGGQLADLSTPLRMSLSGWTERGLYYFVPAETQSTPEVGDLYLLDTITYTTHLVRVDTNKPFLISPSGDELISLDNRDGRQDVLKIRAISDWNYEKFVTLPGKLVDRNGEISEVAQGWKGSVISLLMDGDYPRAVLFDWNTQQVWDCGSAVSVIAWRSNVQSALAVRGLGPLEGTIGWFRISTIIDPISPSTCREVK